MTDKSLMGSRLAGGNTAYSRNQSDYYPTPPDATEALLQHLSLPQNTYIWEPACGEGHMADVFIKHGHRVIASDLIYQGYGDGEVDFLTADLPNGVEWIITNPPFNLAEDFVRRCSTHGKPFALLLKSQYWHAKKRYELFKEVQPTEILPLTWRPDFLFKTRGRGSPVMDCLWCVWNGKDTKTSYHPLLRPQ